MSSRFPGSIALTSLALSTLLAAAPGSPQTSTGWSATEFAKVVPSSEEEEAGFGGAIAIEGDTAVVASEGAGPGNGGLVFIMERDPLTGDWLEAAILDAGPGSAPISFGHSVAIDGDTVVVGDPWANSNGQVHVFARNQGGPDAWGKVTELVPASTGPDNFFGWSVALSGATIVVGAPMDRHQDATGSAFGDGSVYLFEQVQGVWTESVRLNASDAEPSLIVVGDWFGGAVALEGDRMIVGSEQDDHSGFDNAGSAYVFERDTLGIWSETNKLVAPDPQLQSRFGSALDLDGDRLAVGAPQHDDQGTAFVFDRTAPNLWTETARVAAGDAQADDEFGASVSLEGDSLAVGAPENGPAGQPGAGAGYLFQRNQNGPDAWGEVARLFASDAAPYDGLGTSIATTPRGALVGSPGDDNGFSEVQSVSGLTFDPGTGTWYALDYKDLFTVDPVEGWGSLVSTSTNMPTSLESIAYDPGSGTLFGAGGGELYALDTATGANTFIGNIAVPTPSLAFDTSANALRTVYYSTLATIDPATGSTAAPVLGLRPPGVSGMAYDPVADVLYAVDSTHDELVTVDRATGTATTVGSLGFATVECLALNPDTGALYGIDLQTDLLVSIDPGTGLATAIGSVGNSPVIRALAFNPNTGQLIAANQNSNKLISIDPVTLAKTQIGSTGILNIKSLEFDTSSGMLYGTEGARLIQVDPNTASVTMIGSLDTFGFGVNGIALDSSTGTLFGVDNIANQLITIDLATGLPTFHTEPLDLTGVDLRAMAYDPSTGHLFGAGKKLVSIDPTTNDVTTIGSLAPDTYGGLAYDAATNTLLGSTFISDKLMDIDPATATSTLIGDISAAPLIGSFYEFELDYEPQAYCTAGVSASGCQATISASGTSSASAASGFQLSASGVEGNKSGQFFFGVNGAQANPWGNGSSLQCVAPPTVRAGVLGAGGTNGSCNGFFTQDLNTLWSLKPAKNPGPGVFVQAQLWYRDPANPSNQTTSLSDAIEFYVAP